MRLVLEQVRSRKKIASFFQSLKNKSTPDLKKVLPKDFPENLRKVLEFMLRVNPQARPCSELLCALVSCEDFLTVELESRISELRQFMSNRAEEEAASSPCNLKKESSDSELEIEMEINQHNKKVVFDFDFLSKKTKKGPMRVSAKTLILDSLFDFPSPFDLNQECFIKDKSLSAGMSPEKQFKASSFAKGHSREKIPAFFGFEKSKKENPEKSDFEDFNFSKSKLQGEPGYFNFEYDFSNFSSNIWIQS